MDLYLFRLLNDREMGYRVLERSIVNKGHTWFLFWL